MNGELRRFRQTTLLTVLCVAVLVGLAAARRLSFSTWPVVLVFGLFGLYAFKLRNPVGLIAIGLFGFSLGLVRGNTYMQLLKNYSVFMKKPVVIEAQANSDAVYGYSSQLDFNVTNIKVMPASARASPVNLAGQILVDGFGAPMVYRGDTVQLVGKLMPTLGSSQAKMGFAKISIFRTSHSAVDSFRRRFIAGLESDLPEPASSFGAGILIGQRSTIPKGTGDELSITGLTHLVAVSGYNLTIIIIAVRQLFGKRSKFQSSIAAAGLMLLFVLVTGLSASIVRAALVSSLSLLAWYYGRAVRPLLLIVLAAASTALWNPFYLWSDIGWYLSFLAFFGVLVLAPLLVKIAERFTKPTAPILLLTETMSAQVMTLPIIMFIFGRLSLIGLVSNLLVVPLVPLAMLLSLLAGLAGMFMTGLAGWVAWPAHFLLTYMLDVTSILARLPHASVLHKIGLESMLSLYVFILFVILVLQTKLSKKTTGYDKLTE